MASLLQKILFLTILLGVTFINVMAYPSLSNLNNVADEVDTPLRVPLNAPSISNLVIKKSLSNKSVPPFPSSKFDITLMQGEVPLVNVNDTALYGTVYWGTPPQKFTLIFSTIRMNFVVSTSCDTASCKKLWPNRFNKTASATYRRKLKLDDSMEIGNDIFHIMVKDDYFTAKTNFTVVNNEMDKDWWFVNNTQYDGIFSLFPQNPHYVEEFGFGRSPIENLIDQFYNKQLSIWLAQPKRLDQGKTTEAELTIGGLDKEHCKNDWVFLHSQSHRWKVVVTKVEFGDETFGREKAVIITDIMFIVAPGEVVNSILKKTKPYYSDGSHPEMVKCASRKGLPSMKFTIGSKIIEITPQQYILDVKPDIDMCYLAVQHGDNGWRLGQPFMSAQCTAFDFKSGMVGFATPVAI